MHLVRACGQEGQYVELAPGQPDFRSRHRHRPARGIHLDVPGAHGTVVAVAVPGLGDRAAGAPVRAAAYGVDARHQLGHPERLDDVVVGAGPQTLEDVAFLAARGHHDQRSVADGAQPPQEFQPVQVGQAEVEQDELGLAQVQQGVQGPADPADGVAALGEGGAEGLGHPVVVLDEKRVHRPFPLTR